MQKKIYFSTLLSSVLGLVSAQDNTGSNDSTPTETIAVPAITIEPTDLFGDRMNSEGSSGLTTPVEPKKTKKLPLAAEEELLDSEEAERAAAERAAAELVATAAATAAE